MEEKSPIHPDEDEDHDQEEKWKKEESDCEQEKDRHRDRQQDYAKNQYCIEQNLRFYYAKEYKEKQELQHQEEKYGFRFPDGIGSP